jgi:signal peptidase II
MNKLLTKGQLSVLIVFGVLIIDQIIKILVKTNMFWHESIRITDWFYIYFTENNGMACLESYFLQHSASLLWD